jgi:hypothetical protein
MDEEASEGEREKEKRGNFLPSLHVKMSKNVFDAGERA